MSSENIQALNFLFTQKFDVDSQGLSKFHKNFAGVIKAVNDAAKKINKSGTTFEEAFTHIQEANENAAKAIAAVSLAKTLETEGKKQDEEIKRLKGRAKAAAQAKRDLLQNDIENLRSGNLGKVSKERREKVKELFDESDYFKNAGKKYVSQLLAFAKQNDAAWKEITDKQSYWKQKIEKAGASLSEAQQESNKSQLDSIMKDIEDRRGDAKEQQQRLQDLFNKIQGDATKQSASVTATKTQTGGYQTEAKAKDLSSKLAKAASESVDISTKQTATDLSDSLSGMIEAFKEGRISLVQLNNEFQKTNVEAQDLLRSHKLITAEQKEQEKETLNENKLLEKVNDTIKDVRASWHKVAQFDEMKHLTALVNSQLEDMAALADRIGNEDLDVLLTNFKQINNELDSINNQYIDLAKKKKIVDKKETTDLRIKELTTGPVAFDVNDKKIQEVRQLFDDLYDSQNLTTKSTKQLDEQFSHLKNTITELKIEKGNMMQADSAQRRGINDLRMSMHELQGSLFAIQYAAQASFRVIGDVIMSSLNTFGKFEEELNRFAAVSYKAGDSMQTIENNMRKFGEEAVRVALNSKLLITDVEKAGVVLAKMGFSAQEATGMLKTIVLASEASGESVTKVATTIANVYAAYGKSAGALAQPVEHIADVITRIALETKADIEEIGTSFKYVGSIAEETGQDFHTVAAMLELVGKHGIVGSQAGTSIRQILLSLVKDTPDAVAAMKTLGITTTENNGKIKDAATFLKDYAAAMKGLSSSAKAKASEDIFVTTALPSAMAIVSELEKNGDALADVIKKQKTEVDGLTQKMKDLQFKGYNAELAEMKSRVEGLAMVFGKDLEPAALIVVRALAKMITFLTELSPQLKQFLVGLTLVTGGLSALTIGLTGFLMIASQVGIGIATVKDLLLKFAPAVTEAGAAASQTASIWGKLASVFGNTLGVIGGVVTGFTSMREAADAVSMTQTSETMDQWYQALIKLDQIVVTLIASISLAVLTMGPIGGIITGIGMALGATAATWWEHQKAAKADADAMNAANDTIAVRLSTQGQLADLLSREKTAVGLTADEYIRLAHAMSQVGVGAMVATDKRIAAAEKELHLLSIGVDKVESESQGTIHSFNTEKINALRRQLANDQALRVKLKDAQKSRIDKSQEFNKIGQDRKEGANYLNDIEKKYTDIVGLSGKLANNENLSAIARATAKNDIVTIRKEFDQLVAQAETKFKEKKISKEQLNAIKATASQIDAQIKKETEITALKEKGKNKQVDLDNKLIEGINAQTSLRQKQNDIIKMQNDLLKQQIDLSEKDLNLEKLKFKLEQAGGSASGPGGAVGSFYQGGVKSANKEADQLISIAEKVSGAYGTCYNTVYRAYRKHFGDEGMFGKISGDSIPAYKAAIDLAKDARYFEVQLDKTKDFWSQIKKGDTGVFDAGGRSVFSRKYGHIETYNPEEQMAHHFSHDKIPQGRNMSGMRLFRLKSWQDTNAKPIKTQQAEIKNNTKIEKQQGTLEKFDQARLDIISKRYNLGLGELKNVREMIAKEEAALPGAKAKFEQIKNRAPQKVTGKFETEQDYQDAVTAEKEKQEKQAADARSAYENIEKNIHELKLQEGKITGEIKDQEKESLELQLEKIQRHKDQQKADYSYMQEMASMSAKLLEISYKTIDAAEAEHQINLANIDAAEKEAFEQEKSLFGLTDADFAYSKAHQKAIKQREVEDAQYYQNLEKAHKDWVDWNFELDAQMAEMKANAITDDIKRIEALAALETEKRKKKLADDLDAAKKKQNSDLEQLKIQENFNREQLIADRNTKLQILKSLDEITQKRYEALQQQIAMQSKLGADVLEAASMDRRQTPVTNIKEVIEAYDKLSNSIKQPYLITNKMLDEQVDGLNEINRLRQQQIFYINEQIALSRSQSEINDLIAKRTSLQQELNKSQSLAYDLTQDTVREFILMNQHAQQTKQTMTEMGSAMEGFTGGLGKMLDAMSGTESGAMTSFFSSLNEGWKTATDLTEQYILAIAKVNSITSDTNKKVNLPWTDSQKAMQVETQDNGLLGMLTNGWFKSGKKGKKTVKGKGWDAFGAASAQAQGAGAGGGGDLLSTLGGVASAVVPVAGAVMSVIGGAIGFFTDADKKRKELEKELATSRANLLAAEADFLDKRADVFFEKGDISAALYQQNKLTAARNKFQAELELMNLEIAEQEEKGKAGWFGFVGEEQKIARTKVKQLEAQKAAKFAELPQQMRDVEADASKKALERDNELIDTKARVNRANAELYGDSIDMIRVEAAEKRNSLNKELELAYIEQKRLGYSEQANNKVLALEKAINAELQKTNLTEMQTIELEKKRLELTGIQSKRRSKENLDPFSMGDYDRSLADMRDKDRQREMELIEQYNKLQQRYAGEASKSPTGTVSKELMDEIVAVGNELNDVTQGIASGKGSSLFQAESGNLTRDYKTNLFKMGKEVESINAQLRDDQAEQANIDQAIALRELNDEKIKEEQRLATKDKAGNIIRKEEQETIDKQFAAREEKIRRDTAEKKVQIEMDWRKRVRDLSAGEAANTSDELDDIKVAYANTSAEIADEWGKAQKFLSGDKLAQREKELLQQKLAANIEYFNKLADLRRKDLDEAIELDNLKAQNTRDSLKIAVSGAQGQMQQLLFDEKVAMERYKDNEEKKAYWTEYYEEKKKNLKIQSEKEVANAAIDQLNRLSELKEKQFELEVRIYEKEIKANERKISDLQRKIDLLERDKAKIEREIDEAQKKFKVEDKGKFRTDLAGVNIDDTLRSALEYISNPTANQTRDAATETAMEAVKTQVDYLKSKAETAYGLEDIDATEYYKQMISATLQQAKAAQYALSHLDAEQAAELQRYELAGKNEDELRVVRKHHLLERMKLEETYKDAYQDYQKLNNEAIEETRKAEIEVIEDKIDTEKKAVEDLQWINDDKKRIVDDMRYKLEEFTDKIKDKVNELSLKTGDWGMEWDAVKNNAEAVFQSILTGYDAAKAKLSEAITLKIEAPILDRLAQVFPTIFNTDQAGGGALISGGSITAGGMNYSLNTASSGSALGTNPYLSTTDASTGYTYDWAAPASAIKSSPTQTGSYILQGWDSGKWYITSDDRIRGEEYYNAMKAKGAAEGRQPMKFTGTKSIRSGDYLPAMVKNNEWIIPDEKMNNMARGMVRDAIGARGVSGATNTFNMSFGNVYGVDDLKGTINEAIRKANMDDGYHNSVYLVGNN